MSPMKLVSMLRMWLKCLLYDTTSNPWGSEENCLLVSGKGGAIIMNSGLFLLWGQWVPRNDCVSLFELAGSEVVVLLLAW